MARAIHLFNTCERLILQRCRFCRHRSLILERSISTTIFSKPDSLFPTDLFAFGKSGREKNLAFFGLLSWLELFQALAT